ncbi:ECF-type sigma factor, partial [Thermomonas sp.]
MESNPDTGSGADVTLLLARARAGDAAALGVAYSAIYDELKRAARQQLRRMRDDFQTTALVHEAYLKLAGGAQLAAVDRNHLLALSARAMRQVLV